MPEPVYDVVVALNYYAPYVSGVTEAARVAAEAWAERGYKVLVVAGHHDPATPRREVINGVRVVRTPVVARIGKGIVSPSFVPTVLRYARRARLLHVHVPMLEAGAIALGARGVPVLVTYHCDVTLPPGWFGSFQTWALDRSHAVALRRADEVVVTSEDYARSSRLWPVMAGRTVAVPPPARDRTGGAPTFRDGDGVHVGFVGRIVEEKGLEYLVDGFRALDDPDARLLVAGDFARVAGGSVVERVRERIGDDPRIRLTGFLPDEQLPDLYASLDILALPSINSLEAFGIVQVEAMMAGVPAIASDLPGVRMPVTVTGFGRVVPRRDAAAITAAVRELATDPPDRATGAARAVERYGLDVVIGAHVDLVERLGR
ncbi:glycosyl transferase group 1 [Cellulomonas flavigena DSM 20109]|uniref:D-inositol 3-phosphate glycosyltransferase n=1 Tax=Cellulomonas flavigena (strain ATCC 482 / DSM 20109 / BCRC 11376 / JCM 18109 / NBRC 3775 / NCIMB 8073 / NRS 134) TaxID=446466 RepID=D5UHE3_CELFN|nr:glycosyltransferase family 4 protein [Cellulomonas flavigena]ADG75264.1 glycosyl transferase group 1 [Cellulomonas flavigena DSM 20109]